MRPCSTRVESSEFVDGLPRRVRAIAIRAGPLLLPGATTFRDQPPQDFEPIASHPDRFYAQKMLVLVRAGRSVTLSVPNSEEGVALLYDRERWGVVVDGGYRIEDGERAVHFTACRRSEPSFDPQSSGSPIVGRWTAFNGGVIVAGTGCRSIHVKFGHKTQTRVLKFGSVDC